MNNLRPDEIAAYSQIIRNLEQSQNVKKGLKTAASIGSSVLGIGAASKIMPFLNNLIPIDLAIKGISKVSPQIGDFLKKGQSMGLNIQEGLQFIKNNFQTQKQQNPLQDFETKYPDISRALMGYINQGQSPDAAAGILKTSSAFGTKINRLEKEVGKNFVDYVLELFGPQQSQSPPNQSPQEPQIQAEGGLDPQLMQLMQGIRSSIQNIRGR